MHTTTTETTSVSALYEQRAHQIAYQASELLAAQSTHVSLAQAAQAIADASGAVRWVNDALLDPIGHASARAIELARELVARSAELDELADLGAYVHDQNTQR